jgi:hypothetical protein
LRSTFTGSSDCEMKVQSACALNIYIWDTCFVRFAVFREEPCDRH